MKAQEFTHFEHCPNYTVDRYPQDCVCERLWEVEGLERIQAHLENLFKHADEPTIFQWAAFVNGFKAEDEGEDLPEVEDED